MIPSKMTTMLHRLLPKNVKVNGIFDMLAATVLLSLHFSFEMVYCAEADAFPPPSAAILRPENRSPQGKIPTKLISAFGVEQNILLSNF